MDKIAIIGTGNMGSALAKGISKSDMYSSECINLYDPVTEKMNSLSNEINAISYTKIEDAVENSNIVILCVKPDKVSMVSEKISKFLTPGTIVCSIAVGVPISEYRKYIAKEYDFFRIMPNTPALVGEGMSIISYESHILKNSVDKIKKIFSCVGKVQILEEKLMNEVTALTGSSPAYIYILIEAMADAAVKSGIPRDICYRLAAQSVLGSAKMVLETKEHPADLKDKVCSPGGTTIEAVSSLEKNGFRYTLIDAMDKCTEKSNMLSSKYKKGNKK